MSLKPSLFLSFWANISRYNYEHFILCDSILQIIGFYYFFTWGGHPWLFISRYQNFSYNPPFLNYQILHCGFYTTVMIGFPSTYLTFFSLLTDGVHRKALQVSQLLHQTRFICGQKIYLLLYVNHHFIFWFFTSILCKLDKLHPICTLEEKGVVLHGLSNVLTRTAAATTISNSSVEKIKRSKK